MDNIQNNFPRQRCLIKTGIRPGGVGRDNNLAVYYFGESAGFRLCAIGKIKRDDIRGIGMIEIFLI